MLSSVQTILRQEVATAIAQTTSRLIDVDKAPAPAVSTEGCWIGAARCKNMFSKIGIPCHGENCCHKCFLNGLEKRSLVLSHAGKITHVALSTIANNTAVALPRRLMVCACCTVILHAYVHKKQTCLKFSSKSIKFITPNDGYLEERLVY